MQAPALEQDQFASFPDLQAEVFPAALGLAYDINALSTKDYNEDVEDMFEALCDFMTVCSSNWDWPNETIVQEDRCVSLSMLIASIYRGTRAASPALLRLLSQVLLARAKDDLLLKVTKKYAVALLEMALDADRASGLFSAAFFHSLGVRNESLDVILTEANVKLLEDICGMLLGVKDTTGLKNLLLVSNLAKEFAIDNEEFLIGVIGDLDKQVSNAISTKKLTKIDDLVTLLNNLVCNHTRAKRRLAELGIHKQIVPALTQIFGQFIPNDLKQLAMVVLCDLFYFISTWTSECTEAKTCLTSNVIVKAKSKTANLMQILIDFLVITNSKSSEPQKFDKSVQDKVWVPTGFRIVTASLTNIECRAMVIRTQKFVNQSERDLDVLNPDVNREVLWLDLLLSLTTFQDGQAWLGKNNELINILVEKADNSEQQSTSMSSLASLAILRNLAFNSSVKSKLLLLPNYMSVMSRSLASQDHGNRTRLRLVLTTLWALSANNHKAKVALLKAGISRRLEQLRVPEGDENYLLLSTVSAVLIGTEN